MTSAGASDGIFPSVDNHTGFLYHLVNTHMQLWNIGDLPDHAYAAAHSWRSEWL